MEGKLPKKRQRYQKKIMALAKRANESQKMGELQRSEGQDYSVSLRLTVLGRQQRRPTVIAETMRTDARRAMSIPKVRGDTHIDLAVHAEAASPNSRTAEGAATN